MVDEKTGIDGYIPFEGPRTIVLGKVRNPATFPVDSIYDDTLTGITWELWTADEKRQIATGTASHASGSTLGYYHAELPATVQLSRGEVYVLIVRHTTFVWRSRLMAFRSTGAGVAA